MAESRVDGRRADELRQLSILSEFNPFADGSAEVNFGNTKLLISAKIDTVGNGQIHTHLSMLPLATQMRIVDASSTVPEEIRLIEKITSQTLAASLASAAVNSIDIDLYVMVCVADGGVAAASVAGGWVAMYQVLSTAAEQGIIQEDLDLPRVAAVAAGLVNGEARLDLLSEETTNADFHQVVCASVLGGVIGVHAQSQSLNTSSQDIQELTQLCLDSMQPIFDAQAAAVT